MMEHAGDSGEILVIYLMLGESRFSYLYPNLDNAVKGIRAYTRCRDFVAYWVYKMSKKGNWKPYHIPGELG